MQEESLNDELDSFETKLAGWLARDKEDGQVEDLEAIDEEMDAAALQRRKMNLMRFKKDLERQTRIGAIDKQVSPVLLLTHTVL